MEFKEIIQALPDLKGSFIGEIIEKMLMSDETNDDFLSDFPDFNPETDERGLGYVNELEKTLLSMSLSFTSQEKGLKTEIEKIHSSLMGHGDVEDTQFVLIDLCLQLYDCRNKFKRIEDLFSQNIHRRFRLKSFDVLGIRKGGKIILLKEKKVINVIA